MIDDLVRIVKSSGTELIELSKDGRIGGEWYGSQLKTEADSLIDKKLQADLKDFASNIPILSEECEDSYINVGLDEYFLIDPIDGTASYAQGYSGFVVQLALVSGGVPRIAVVYQPLKDLLFTASSGHGAWLNGDRIQVRGEVDEVVLTDNYPEPRGTARVVLEQLDQPRYLESGSIGLKMCLVAAGRADLFVKDVMCKTWDVAPGDLILREAGGVVTDIRGYPFSYRRNYIADGILCARSKPLYQRVQQHLFREEA